MKKYIALAIACAALAAGVSYLPAAVEASVPAAVSISPTEVYYSESVNTSGTLCYIGQGDVTSALPLVLSEFAVEEGDHVEVGDVIARVDRKASETFISSLGKVSQLAAATASLSTAMSLIPEEITADRSGTVISTAGAGAAVESGTSIATIAGTDSLVLTSAVSELNIARIQPGQPVEFTLSAYPDDVFTGTVSKIAGSARSQYSGAVLETVVDVRLPRTPPTRACAQAYRRCAFPALRPAENMRASLITPSVRTRRVSMSTCLKMEPLSSTRFSPARNFQTVQRS